MNIRIVSPSGAIDPRFIDGAALRLQEWGHQVTIAPHAKARFGGFAGTAEQRLQDLNNAFLDPTVEAILCARGGYGLQQIIDRIEPTKKLVIGFSDISALHQLMRVRFADQMSLHGPMCKHIATWQTDCASIRHLRAVLDGHNLKYELPTHTLTSWQGQATGELGYAEGELVGGNLSVLYGLQATEYSLQKTVKEGSILFLEDIGEPHHHIDRMMQNLRMSGVLSRLSALVVGQFTGCRTDRRLNVTLWDSIRDAAKEYGYPIIFGFPAGHDDENLPMMFGRQCKIELTAEKTVFMQSL